MGTRTPDHDSDGYAPAELVDTPRQDLALLRADSFDNLDGYKNEISGFGDWTRDKTFGGNSRGPEFIVKLMSGTECEDRWRGSDLGGRIIETIPDEMTREGWEFQIQSTKEEAKADGVRELTRRWRERRDFFEQMKAQAAGLPMAPKRNPGELEEPDDAGSAISEELDLKCKKLKALEAFWKALCYERAYGGAAIFIGVDDGEQDLSKPLDLKKVKSVKHLTVFRGGWDGELTAWSWYNNVREPKFGEPEIYMWRNLGVPLVTIPAPMSAGAAMISQANMLSSSIVDFIHESRLLIFPGTPVSYRTCVQMRGWGDSVFTRIDEVLSDYGQTWKAVAIIMQEFSQGTLKIDGLARLLASKNPQDQGVVAARALALNMSQSIARVRMLDKNEEFERVTSPLGGVSEILEQFSFRLAAAADQPVSMLMGQRSGLNASGDTDYKMFCAKISAKMKKRMQPQLERLGEVMFAAKDGPTRGVEPERWHVEFHGLIQLSEKEQAELRKTQSETDHNYIGDSVVSPEEIAASRFAGSKYSTDTVIDFETRRKMAAQDQEMAAAREQAAAEAAKNPPAPAAPGAPGQPPKKPILKPPAE